MIGVVALAADGWWIAPAVAAGAGAATAIGMRGRRSSVERRLAHDAARRDLKEAQLEVGEHRRAVKVARAEHSRAIAERSASRASSADVASSRRMLKQAEQNLKVAAADVRARRVHVKVAYAEIPPTSARERYPLTKLYRAHDAVLARWMDYETDPAKLIAYPAMSDGKEPATSAFLTASQRASELRASLSPHVTTAEFSAYRDAVAHLERAFDVAEHTAKARANGVDPNAGQAWQDAAQQVFVRSAEALDKAAGAAASAFAAWNERRPAKDRSADESRAETDSSTAKPARRRPGKDETPPQQ
ncbi:hypothetical protein ACW5CM_14465 [Microbacterium sp. A588]